MTDALTLAIDVGTGSIRAALVDDLGIVVAITARPHEQIVTAVGRSEQRAADWWEGAVAAIREVIRDHPGAPARIRTVVACGQMHGTVLVAADGTLVCETVPLWNDKRAASLVRAFDDAHPVEQYLPHSANPASPAWPAFKLQWYRDHLPEALARTYRVMMPKDYVNFRLTGEIAMDFTEAACSFLIDPRTRDWSAVMLGLTGLPAAILPPIRQPLEVLGTVSAEAAALTGLWPGTPVLVGCGDFPAALLGSGAISPDVASEVMGTSAIITLIAPEPLLHPGICNVGTADGAWGAFMLLESGGDAMRWGQRVLGAGTETYAAFLAAADSAPPGAKGAIFTPYLTGERLGAGTNARAQFFGLSAAHGPADLRRAILEGVAFGVNRHIRMLEASSGARISHIVASGGGTRASLWLRIKASVYDRPIRVPREAESSIVGCGILGSLSRGAYPDVATAVVACVDYAAEIAPVPEWQDIYGALQPIFDSVHAAAAPAWIRLDSLPRSAGSGTDPLEGGDSDVS